MKKQVSWLLFCGILSGLTACTLPVQSPSGAVTQATRQQYQTVSALLTEIIPDDTGTPPVPSSPPGTAPAVAHTQTALWITPLAGETASPLLTAASDTPAAMMVAQSTAVACDLAQPGRPIDVTVPDDTPFHPGENFSKTWRLVNAGSCAWDGHYTVFWFSGDDLGTTHHLPVSEAIPPGKSIDITVDMHAPQEPGTYQSNWKMSNGEGKMFGIGTDGDAPFWVRIIVVPFDTETPAPSEIPLEMTQTPAATPRAQSGGLLYESTQEAVYLQNTLSWQAP